MEAPAGGNQDRGPALLAIYWTECVVALTVVSLRTTSRVMYTELGPDDYAMIITMILFVCLTAFVTYYAKIGGCRHLFYLTASERVQAVKYNWATQPWGIFGFAAGKISVSLLIFRLIGPNQRWIRRILWLVMISVFIINTLDCILTFVQCNPPRALWDSSLVTEGKATCWNADIQGDYAIFISSWNVFVDIILAVLPMTVFWRLRLQRMKKVTLCVLLGLGLIAAACGLVKIFFLAGLTARSDLTWETYDLFAWSGSELFIIIVCGSVPPIKPLYDRVTGYKKSQSTGYQYHLDSLEDQTTLVVASASGQHRNNFTNKGRSVKVVAGNKRDSVVENGISRTVEIDIT